MQHFRVAASEMEVRSSPTQSTGSLVQRPLQHLPGMLPLAAVQFEKGSLKKIFLGLSRRRRKSEVSVPLWVLLTLPISERIMNFDCGAALSPKKLSCPEKTCMLLKLW